MWAATNEPKVVVALAKRFGLRLLTEEEWEYVARDGGQLGWGEDLEILLRRVYRDGPTPKDRKNRFGIQSLVAPAFVDTGKKTPDVARSLAWASYKFASEMVSKAIANARTQKREWRAAMFAVDVPGT